MNRFDRDTAVTRESDGRYRARMDTGWWVVHGPNGGYVAAVLLRGMTEAVGDPARAPRSLNIHYLRPPAEGEAFVDTTVERVGRSLTTVSARLVQGDRLLAIALGAFSKPRSGVELQHAPRLEVPSPEGLPIAEPRIPLSSRYEYRYAPGLEPSQTGDQALVAGWIRPAEPRPLDPLLLAAYTDAFPPPLYRTAREPGEFGPLPTVDLNIHFRAHRADATTLPADFCLGVFRSRMVHEGFVEEDGEIWSREGVLLAQSRQLAVLTGV
ncbi:MAG: thioesterase family protein [Proteobacteria bacterium]|nr:thioesterase family protein [Pseudomonadota bacterium]